MLSRREALLGVMLAPLVKPVVAMLPKASEWVQVKPHPWRETWIVSDTHPYLPGDHIAFGDGHVKVVSVSRTAVTIERHPNGR